MIRFCYRAEISGTVKSNMDCKVLYKRKKVCRQLCEFGVAYFVCVLKTLRDLCHLFFEVRSAFGRTFALRIIMYNVKNKVADCE